MENLTDSQLQFIEFERNNASYYLINIYRKHAVKLTNKFLPFLIAEGVAYIDAVEKALMNDYNLELKDNNLDTHDLLQDIEENLIEKEKANIKPKFKATFDDTIIKSLKEKTRLYYLFQEPTNYLRNKETYKARSVIEERNESFLPKYTKYRKRQARTLIKKYGIRTDIVNRLQTIAFEEILFLIGSKNQLFSEEVDTVRFLELIGIEYSLRILLTDLGISNIDIKSLRRDYQARFGNTVCWRCGRVLLRLCSIFKKIKGSKEYIVIPDNYCKKRENRSCLEKRMREDKRYFQNQQIKLMYRGICQACNRELAAEVYAGQVFCDKKCYERFRKRKRRQILPT